jgi:hypothetical protein
MTTATTPFWVTELPEALQAWTLKYMPVLIQMGQAEFTLFLERAKAGDLDTAQAILVAAMSVRQVLDELDAKNAALDTANARKQALENTAWKMLYDFLSVVVTIGLALVGL